MGIKILHLAGPLAGDFDVYASSGAYVAGSPLKIDANGISLCTDYIETSDDGFIGFARNHMGSTSDRKSDIYNGKAAFIAGKGNMLELNNDDPENADDVFPFHDNTYVNGQELYVSTTGKLTNTNPGSSNGGTTTASSIPVAIVMIGRTSASGDNLTIMTL